MNMYLKIYLFGVVFVVLMSGKVMAQGEPNKSGSFDPIKMQMMATAKENAALIADNKRLQTKLVGLQLEVERHEGEISELNGEFTGDILQMSDFAKVTPGSTVRLEKPQEHDLIDEVQDLYMSGQFMDSDVEQKLRETYLYDLQYQKQELDLDLQEKKMLYKDIEEQQQQELDAIQKDIQRNIEKEAVLKHKISELEETHEINPQDIELLRIENKELKKKIRWIERSLVE